MAKRSRARLFWSCALMAMLVLAAGCTSSSGAGSGNTSAVSSSVSGGASSAATNKSQVVIGALVDLTGPQAGAGGGVLTKVLPAWEKWTNAHGGINGHPVKVEMRDTNSDAATTLSEAKHLLKDNPIAWFLYSTSTETSIASFLGTTGIPIVGAGYAPQVWGGELHSLGTNCSTAPQASFPCALPNAFPITTTFGAVVDAVAVAAKQVKATKFTFVACVETASCTSANSELAKTAAGLGFPSYSPILVNTAATSYVSQCLQLIQSHIDFSYIAVQPPGSLNMATQCYQQGYNGWFGAAGSVINGGLMTVPGIRLAGDLTSFPWFVSDPPVVQYRDAMASKGVSSADYSTSTGTATWSALQLFAKANAKLVDSPTAADSLANMYTLNNENLGGLIAPVTFTKGQPASARNCFWEFQYENGTATNPLGGLNYSCYPSK